MNLYWVNAALRANDIFLVKCKFRALRLRIDPTLTSSIGSWGGQLTIKISNVRCWCFDVASCRCLWVNVRSLKFRTVYTTCNTTTSWCRATNDGVLACGETSICILHVYKIVDCSISSVLQPVTTWTSNAVSFNFESVSNGGMRSPIQRVVL